MMAKLRCAKVAFRDGDVVFSRATGPIAALDVCLKHPSFYFILFFLEKQMICFKDKSTIAISCHMVFSRRISLSFFLNNAKPSVRKLLLLFTEFQVWKLHFPHSSADRLFLFVFYFSLITFTVKDTNMWPLRSNVIYAIKCLLGLWHYRRPRAVV